jgi:hypothetical protein
MTSRSLHVGGLNVADLSKKLNTGSDVSMLLVASELHAKALSALESHDSVNVVVITRFALCSGAHGLSNAHHGRL